MDPILIENAQAGKSGSTDKEEKMKSNEREDNSSVALPSKKRRRGTLRKRSAIDEDSSEEGTADVPSTKLPLAVSKIQKKDKEGKVVTAPFSFTTKRNDRTEMLTFSSSEQIQVRSDDAATRANKMYMDDGLHTAGGSETRSQRGVDDNKEEQNQIYRGLTGYKDYRAGFRREDGSGDKKAYGPLRAPTNIRTSIRVDYQPDICKDYKETGYCGFGDACKFLHDRGDYKAGWELDREWEEKQKAKQEQMLQFLDKGGDMNDIDSDGKGSEDSDEDDEVPFACFICRKPWSECKDPVVTRCGHYFCEQCALRHNAKSSKCFVCDQPTGGIFNVAHDVIKKEKERKRKEVP